LAFHFWRSGKNLFCERTLVWNRRASRLPEPFVGWPSFAWLAQLALEMVPGVVAKNGKASYVDMVDGSQLLFD